MRSFFTKKKYDTKDHFVIEINTENDRNLVDEIKSFINLAEEYGAEMLMIGGGAVNFHDLQKRNQNFFANDEQLKPAP